MRPAPGDVLPPGYEWPDWSAPLDVDAAIRAVPVGATGKGMFLERLMGELRRNGLSLTSRERFIPFKDYPLKQCLQVNVDAAKRLYPESSVRDALRRVAHLSFDTFARSMLGRITFSALGRDPAAIFRLAPVALRHSTNIGEFDVEMLGPSELIMHARDSYLYPQSFGVGMSEGMLESCGRTGLVAARQVSDHDWSFYVRWE